MTLEWLAELALLKEQNAQLVKERDAAIHDLKECVDCQVCKSYDVEDNVCIAKNCRCGEAWEWRGVQNEID